ncbi:MAG: hypothetical protein LBP22_12550 [Deltaproteobacteria bacterium]|jgi:hypothetical protein|nr:hypothetical protein [Deltaproteobacteria bacterium]
MREDLLASGNHCQSDAAIFGLWRFSRAALTQNRRVFLSKNQRKTCPTSLHELVTIHWPYLVNDSGFLPAPEIG